jgi:glycerophosphoryl diester phosphodiesterase
VQPVRATEWESGAIASGEMTQFPDSDAAGLHWPEPGVIALAAQRRQAFLTLGQLAPLEHAAGPYQIDLEVRVDAMPENDGSNFTVAFAHTDDRYYEHRQGTLDGYHAMLRMDGTMELRVHRAGSESGSELGKNIPGPAPAVGKWIGLRLNVGAKQIDWTRTDTGATVSTQNSEFRGDILHIGRSATDGKISVRGLRVS